MDKELSKGFTGIEINGVRFSNIREMLIYMDKQRYRIIDLEKEIADLKCECRTCVYTDSPCVRSDYPSKDGICSHYKNVFDENAELKKENKVLAQNLEDTEILNKTYEKRFSDLEKEKRKTKRTLKMLDSRNVPYCTTSSYNGSTHKNYARP